MGMDWDNLRFFLALARSESLSAAAKALGVDHTTVSRRVQALERELGTQLFVRENRGYSMTDIGRRLIPLVERMEGASANIEQVIPGGGDELSGQVRVGATEGYGTTVLAPQLVQLAERYPKLHIDLMPLPRAVRLSRREADIVITLERPEKGPYIITRLTDYVLHLYGSESYLAGKPPIGHCRDLRGHRFVSYIDDLLFSDELKLIDEIAKPQEIAFRSTSVLAQQEAVASGAGLGILPVFSASRDHRLKEVLPNEVKFVRTFWMLMPIEHKNNARVRVVWDFLKNQAG